jgi:hypothetical protein
VNGWWLLPQLAVHACFAVGAGILSGFAELTRPTPAVPSTCPPGCPLAEFTTWDWDDSELPRERL